MTEDEAIPLVTELICKGRNMEASQVSATTCLVDDLGFDSLDAAELLAALHKETGIQLDVESFHDLRTVHDIARELVDSDRQQKVGTAE